MSYQLITLVAAALGMTLVGLTYNAAPVLFMVAAIAAILLVSYASCLLSARALRGTRWDAGQVFENEAFTVTAELANEGRAPRLLTTVADKLPSGVRAEEAPEFVLPALWPGQRARVSYQARAAKRGAYQLGPLSVAASDPFGIFQRWQSLPAVAEAIVYPRPVPISGDLDRAGAEPRGAASGERARAVDSGLDFYGVRDYQPGDDLRRIHWPATAHHGRLTVVEFERGASGSLTVVLDTKAGTEFGAGRETTLEVGVKAAASLLHWALENDGSAHLALDSAHGPRWVEVDRASGEHELLEALARAEAEGTMPVSAVAAWAQPRIPWGSAVYIVTAAPDEGLPFVVSDLLRGGAHIAFLLLDASSFNERAATPEEMTASVRSAGAATTTVKRGDDLGEVLRSVLVAGG